MHKWAKLRYVPRWEREHLARIHEPKPGHAAASWSVSQKFCPIGRASLPEQEEKRSSKGRELREQQYADAVTAVRACARERYADTSLGKPIGRLAFPGETISNLTPQLRSAVLRAYPKSGHYFSREPHSDRLHRGLLGSRIGSQRASQPPSTGYTEPWQ